MTRPLIRIHDLSTNEITDREMNDEELAEFEAQQKQATQAKKDYEIREAQKLALLDKLGITEDEAKLLLS